MILTSEMMIPVDQVDDDFVLDQSVGQRKRWAKAKRIQADQIHNKEQVAQHASRNLHFRTQDSETGEWGEGGCAITRDKSEETHRKIVRMICKKTVEENGEKALDKIKGTFKPLWMKIILRLQNRLRTSFV